MLVSRTCGGFSYLKKIFGFNSRKERQILTKCNIKETYYAIFERCLHFYYDYSCFFIVFKISILPFFI